MKISKYNMPWGVLVVLQAGDMQCIRKQHICLHLLPLPSVTYMISMNQTSMSDDVHNIRAFTYNSVQQASFTCLFPQLGANKSTHTASLCYYEPANCNPMTSIRNEWERKLERRLYCVSTLYHHTLSILETEYTVSLKMRNIKYMF